MVSDAPPEYTSAVSIKFTPASRAISTKRRASAVSSWPQRASAAAPPKFAVPSAMIETLRPDLPRVLYSIAFLRFLSPKLQGLNHLA